MRKAAAEGFINATDAADYLVKKGMPFRTAYKITGQLVAKCIAQHQTLERLPLSEYQAMSELFTSDIYEAVNLDTCVKSRISANPEFQIIEDDSKRLKERIDKNTVTLNLAEREKERLEIEQRRDKINDERAKRTKDVADRLKDNGFKVIIGARSALFSLTVIKLGSSSDHSTAISDQSRRSDTFAARQSAM